ncbi:hypothetical protein L9F63_007656, partial [Diploptera punctata]
KIRLNSDLFETMILYTALTSKIAYRLDHTGSSILDTSLSGPTEYLQNVSLNYSFEITR